MILLGCGFAHGQLIRPGPSITIDYSNCLAVTGFSQSLMNAVTNYNCYFAMASVGTLMTEGLTNLHLANPSFYQLQGRSFAETPPPSNTLPGIIYGDDRGHSTTNNYVGDWQYEVGYFQTAINNGWTYPRVNLAMNILSFIDIWYNNSTNGVAQLLNGYIGSMTNLEAAFPKTVFVYVTMPITTTNYGFEVDVEPADEYWRCLFNNSLRAWCSANNRVLFDVADIEARDTNGNLCSFTYNGLLCEQLWIGDNQGGDACCSEIGDGAHPTNFGAEELIAKGFYALAAALLGQTQGQPSEIVLSSSANPSPSDRSVVFTAQISGTNVVPTGTVQFSTNGISAGQPIPMTNGQSSCALSGLLPGTNTISATYGGDSNYLSSATNVAQVVVPWSGVLRVIGWSNGLTTLACTGVPGFGYILQRSTNLQGSWLTLGDTNAPSSGVFQWWDNFSDLAKSPEAAFYRLRQP